MRNIFRLLQYFIVTTWPSGVCSNLPKMAFVALKETSVTPTVNVSGGAGGGGASVAGAVPAAGAGALGALFYYYNGVAVILQ